MGVMMPYGATIREALASNDLTKMEAIAEQAKQTIKQQGDLTAAYLELIEAIAALKTKKQFVLSCRNKGVSEKPKRVGII